MARFGVQHFLACPSVSWEGAAGPNTTRVLEGVGYQYLVEPDKEPPFELPEFWLYARLLLTEPADVTLVLSVKMVWLDRPGGATVVRVDPVGRVRMTAARPWVDASWPLRPFQFPGRGRYQFRLVWRSRVLARDHLFVERRS